MSLSLSIEIVSHGDRLYLPLKGMSKTCLCLSRERVSHPSVDLHSQGRESQRHSEVDQTGTDKGESQKSQRLECRSLSDKGERQRDRDIER